jgi:hypothetical protein
MTMARIDNSRLSLARQTGGTSPKENTMFRDRPELARRFAVAIAALLFVVSTVFVSVPLVLEAHPWEAGSMAAASAGPRA